MARRSFTRFVEQELGKFPHFLLFAVLEWVLILLLFIDVFLAFVANEFAKFFELQVPCLLCTRIDHVLVHRDPDFYYNHSVCEAHKKDISSLAYCHNHKKLSDIGKMCEGCLLSFAAEKESDCNTYKSLHKDLERLVEDDNQIHLSLPARKKDEILHAEKSNVHQCSCCRVQLKLKSSYSKGRGARAYSLAPAPSPRTPFVILRNEEIRSLDSPRTRYTELKFISDKDSLREDEDGLHAFSPGLQFGGADVKAATVSLFAEAEDLNDDGSKTPTFARGNRFFGIPLTDSGTNSPKWGTRITRKMPLGKTLFASESSEENLPNEADNDSILHHLKRQVRLDRNSLMALCMELDEERSASAVAANNAMAMITRIQAEKAAVQMDALQYQRMMEEQAEYDQEALQETTDLLAKREEEFKILEAELEAYRIKYGSLREDGFSRDKIGAEDYLEHKSRSYSSYSAKSESGLSYVSVNELEINGEDAQNNYGGVTISESLKDLQGEDPPGSFEKLENRNHLLSENGVHSPRFSSDCAEHTSDEIGKQRRPFLTRELSHLSQRVKALEADNGFLENAAQTLEKHSEGAKLLIEISRNMRKLRQLVTMPLGENDA